MECVMECACNCLGVSRSVSWSVSECLGVCLGVSRSVSESVSECLGVSRSLAWSEWSELSLISSSVVSLHRLHHTMNLKLEMVPLQ